MAASATVIIALRFQDGVVFASDSQASDLVQGVRWQTTKAQQVGSHPLVVAFTGNMGVAGRARDSVEQLSLRGTTFQKRERVRKMIESAFTEHFEWIAARMKPESAFKDVVGAPQMAALAACWAEDSPTIIEYGRDGDSEFHEYFHAVGSGAPTAYAVWRTLGGRQLLALTEARALHVALRIMRTAVSVDAIGVAEPFTVFVVGKGGCRALAQAEVDTEAQAAQEWEAEQTQQLLDQE